MCVRVNILYMTQNVNIVYVKLLIVHMLIFYIWIIRCVGFFITHMVQNCKLVLLCHSIA